jgi:hypothetical protein
MLDRLPPGARHLSLLMIAALISWSATEFFPALENPMLASLGGALAVALLAYVTPLVRTYGVGSHTEGTETE